MRCYKVPSDIGCKQQYEYHALGSRSGGHDGDHGLLNDFRLFIKINRKLFPQFLPLNCLLYITLCAVHLS